MQNLSSEAHVHATSARLSMQDNAASTRARKVHRKLHQVPETAHLKSSQIIQPLGHDKAVCCGHLSNLPQRSQYSGVSAWRVKFQAPKTCGTEGPWPTQQGLFESDLHIIKSSWFMWCHQQRPRFAKQSDLDSYFVHWSVRQYQIAKTLSSACQLVTRSKLHLQTLQVGQMEDFISSRLGG